ncbi:MerR family transcriptional regulator [Streptomyces sp. NPDC005017]|uniref:MerR family transcriptional regulator n=1 Tax=Streptomyces sp. NPDC005017 TaxID=3364706 RepID=UPI0036A8084C
MRIKELSRLSGVPVATIKYYLREGLLPPGRPTAATQAEYDEQHVRRLKLVRALIGVRGLSVSAAKNVVNAVTEEQTDVHTLLGLVSGMWPLGTDPGGQALCETPPGDSETDALLAELGWSVTEHNPARQVLDHTLLTLRSLGMDYDWRFLLPYARLVHGIAALDLDQLRAPLDPLEKAEQAVLLTFLLEPALLALRRLAQEAESHLRYGALEAAREEPGPD